MKFVEISKNVCVNIDQISWVKSENDGLTSSIYVGGKEYPSDIMYQSFVDILKSSTGEELKQKLDNYLSNVTITTV